MGVTRGKQFEKVVQECFEKVEGVSIDRIHDQTTGFKGSSNISDFVLYKKPYEYYFECKSTQENTLSIYSKGPERKYGAFTNKQWEGILEKSKIRGVTGGALIWFIKHDVTMYVPIHVLQELRDSGAKSIRYDFKHPDRILLCGEKKRVFFKYYMKDFLEQLEWRFKVGHEN